MTWGLLNKLLMMLKKPFDLKKIYVVGMSNGGKMAHALASEFSKDISGVINVVGSPQNGLACEPKLQSITLFMLVQKIKSSHRSMLFHLISIFTHQCQRWLTNGQLLLTVKIKNF